MMRTSCINAVTLLLLLLNCVVLSGCSKGDRPPLGRVSGTATIDGQPLVGAIVTFQPTKGRAAEGLTDAKGKYTLTYSHRVQGAKVGPNQVAFTWPIGFAGSHAIPARYAGKTELTRDVKAGKNTFDFDLESDPNTKPVAAIEE